jgi:hypothetical protein
MPKFGSTSKAKLATCHPDIQRVLNEAIKHVDFSVTCGERSMLDQNIAFDTGMSTVRWPNSKHNVTEGIREDADAVDVAPYVNGIKWDDLEGFTLLSGIIKGIAIMMGVDLRIGVDWDGDLFVKEHSFIDRPHIELK